MTRTVLQQSLIAEMTVSFNSRSNVWNVPKASLFHDSSKSCTIELTQCRVGGRCCWRHFTSWRASVVTWIVPCQSSIADVMVGFNCVWKFGTFQNLAGWLNFMFEVSKSFLKPTKSVIRQTMRHLPSSSRLWKGWQRRCREGGACPQHQMSFFVEQCPF